MEAGNSRCWSRGRAQPHPRAGVLPQLRNSDVRRIVVSRRKRAAKSRVQKNVAPGGHPGSANDKARRDIGGAVCRHGHTRSDPPTRVSFEHRHLQVRSVPAQGRRQLGRTATLNFSFESERLPFFTVLYRLPVFAPRAGSGVRPIRACVFPVMRAHHHGEQADAGKAVARVFGVKREKGTERKA